MHGMALPPADVRLKTLATPKSLPAGFLEDRSVCARVTGEVARRRILWETFGMRYKSIKNPHRQHC